VIDKHGFRANVGIIVANQSRELLWARRAGSNDAWQFPQGGVNQGETPLAAAYRELFEEVGLRRQDVKLLGQTRSWLRYRLPQQYWRLDANAQPLCIGQKQIWFLFRLIQSDDHVHLNRMRSPEFDKWRWVSYWYPLHHVVDFKKDVYRRALRELAPLIHTTRPIITNPPSQDSSQTSNES